MTTDYRLLLRPKFVLLPRAMISFFWFHNTITAIIVGAWCFTLLGHVSKCDSYLLWYFFGRRPGVASDSPDTLGLCKSEYEDRSGCLKFNVEVSRALT